MKSIIKMPLAIIAIAIFVLGLCACDIPLMRCEHVYTNPCDGDCNLCGEPREPGEHEFAQANCTTPKTCIYCGVTEGDPDADVHDWQYRDAYSELCTRCQHILVTTDFGDGDVVYTFWDPTMEIRLTVTNYNGGILHSHEVYSYDSNGKRVRYFQTIYAEDGVDRYTLEYLYDDNGLLISETTFYRGGYGEYTEDYTHLQTITYDDEGRAVALCHYSNGKFTEGQYRSYNRQGLLSGETTILNGSIFETREIQYYENGNRSYEVSYYEDTNQKKIEIYYYENGKTKVDYAYNRDGTLSYSNEYTEDGGLIEK